MMEVSMTLDPDSPHELRQIAIEHLHSHPSNPNQMKEPQLAKLTSHIAATGRYPPLIVRPHPELAAEFQVIDGHQRLRALKRLDTTHALCDVWNCNDEEALILL